MLSLSRAARVRGKVLGIGEGGGGILETWVLAHIGGLGAAGADGASNGTGVVGARGRLSRG